MISELKLWQSKSNANEEKLALLAQELERLNQSLQDRMKETEQLRSKIRQQEEKIVMLSQELEH